MATGSSWADLPSDLLVSIADRLSLRDYTCLHGVCNGWRRSALVPPYPCLLSLNDVGSRCSIFSLPMQRSFHRKRALFTGFDGCGRIVGSGNGRLAVAVDNNGRTARIFLLDPRGREEAIILLPPPLIPLGNYESVRKVVFAPDPDDGTVVAMCDRKRVAYVDTRKKGRDMEWRIVEIFAGDRTFHLADLAFLAGAPGGDGKVYCLDSSGGVRVLLIPRRRPEEPWLSVLSASFRTAFPRPYGVASELTFTKHLFFFRNNLHQVWQNNSATVRSGSRLTMAADEIFVLRHDPGRQEPCWNMVKNLGGCSVFVGKNSSPAVVRAGAVPGVKGDCVYWIDWRGKPMVCDVATGASKPCLLPCGASKVSCWYFGDDNMTRNNKRRHKGSEIDQ